jgi:putative SbcD/Mre11-related phosphoesterase
MEKTTNKTPEYIFIDKSLFFPEQGILVIGDLHIGYEQSLVESGILLPEQQVIEVIDNLKKIIKEIKEKKYELKKIVFLGDIKHFFGYKWKEKANFNKILEFLNDYVDEKNIIIIRGNHDTMDLGLQFKDYYIDSGIAFLHGHDSFPEIYDKTVDCIVTGHLHPSVILEENPGVKKEVYKCFLIGSTKGRVFIVMPSFLEFYEGTPVNYYAEDFIESFSIIPKKEILKARVHVIGKNEIYDFGRVGDL